MSIFRIDGGKAIHVAPTTFHHLGYLERRDIQRVLRDSITFAIKRSATEGGMGKWYA
jgi:hypothetical protein